MYLHLFNSKKYFIHRQIIHFRIMANSGRGWQVFQSFQCQYATLTVLEIINQSINQKFQYYDYFKLTSFYIFNYFKLYILTPFIL